MCSMSTTVRLDVQETAEVHGEYGILSNYSGAYMCIYAVGPCFTKHAKLSLVFLACPGWQPETEHKSPTGMQHRFY